VKRGEAEYLAQLGQRQCQTEQRRHRRRNHPQRRVGARQRRLKIVDERSANGEEFHRAHLPHHLVAQLAGSHWPAMAAILALPESSAVALAAALESAAVLFCASAGEAIEKHRTYQGQETFS